ncbi:MAG: hypothetical protein J5510_04020 [Prevotella sp.]|nr:hypothetical protein [Prevotella sp.]
MKQEDKDLLLKDLCARLPYNVKVVSDLGGCRDLTLGDSDLIDLFYPDESCLEPTIKPYLRPMSSMTEEECLELSRIKPIYDEVEAWKYIKTPIPLHIANIEQFEFFNSHHLDWRNLIPKGLALEAIEGMYQIK